MPKVKGQRGDDPPLDSLELYCRRYIYNSEDPVRAAAHMHRLVLEKIKERNQVEKISGSVPGTHAHARK